MKNIIKKTRHLSRTSLVQKVINKSGRDVETTVLPTDIDSRECGFQVLVPRCIGVQRDVNLEV